eukprot:6209080-Pleurochrysis_carterae.AAC.4
MARSVSIAQSPQSQANAVEMQQRVKTKANFAAPPPARRPTSACVMVKPQRVGVLGRTNQPANPFAQAGSFNSLSKRPKSAPSFPNLPLSASLPLHPLLSNSVTQRPGDARPDSFGKSEQSPRSFGPNDTTEAVIAMLRNRMHARGPVKKTFRDFDRHKQGRLRYQDFAAALDQLGETEPPSANHGEVANCCMWA